MSICRQIRLVLWKNFTIRRRRWVCLIFKIEKEIVLLFFCHLASCNSRSNLATSFISYSYVGTNTKFSLLF
jgi:hypothetical protein